MEGHPQLPQLTFAGGVRSLVNGFHFLSTERAARRLSYVPGAVAFWLWLVALYLAVHYLPELAVRLLPALSGLSQGWTFLLDLVTLVVMAPLALLVAILITPVLCAPVMEKLVLMRERALGAGARPSAGLFRELVSALFSQLGALLLFGPVMALLWAISLLAAPLAPLLAVLQFFVGAAWLALSLLDYPLSLRGVPFRARLALLRRGGLAVLGFGAGCALLFAIPLFGLWGLPVAVVGAAELALALER
jgi:uncharacterized protein involved in cysteine biosynthesis